jgi:Uma2 family endonuclease
VVPFVASTTSTRLTTFAEFERLPDPQGGHFELYHGELVEVAPPKLGHLRIQRRLRELLQAAAGRAGEVEIEVGYRPLPEHEYFVSDVALVSRQQWDESPDDGYLLGPPALVIEVLSPSNRTSKIGYKRQMCLANGSTEFWVVDGKRRTVEVSTPGGRSMTFNLGEEIPLFFATSATVSVDAIFG